MGAIFLDAAHHDAKQGDHGGDQEGVQRKRFNQTRPSQWALSSSPSKHLAVVNGSGFNASHIHDAFKAVTMANTHDIRTNPRHPRWLYACDPTRYAVSLLTPLYFHLRSWWEHGDA
jgi:hypothetical protein